MKAFWIWLKQQLINLVLLFSKKLYISTEQVKKCDKDNDDYISLIELLDPFVEKYKIVAKISDFIVKYIWIINIPTKNILSLDEDKDGKITLNEFWKYIKTCQKVKK